MKVVFIKKDRHFNKGDVVELSGSMARYLIKTGVVCKCVEIKSKNK